MSSPPTTGKPDTTKRVNLALQGGGAHVDIRARFL